MLQIFFVLKRRRVFVLRHKILHSPLIMSFNKRRPQLHIICYIRIRTKLKLRHFEFTPNAVVKLFWNHFNSLYTKLDDGRTDTTSVFRFHFTISWARTRNNGEYISYVFGAFQKYFRQSSVRFIWLSLLSRGAENSHLRILQKFYIWNFC